MSALVSRAVFSSLLERGDDRDNHAGRQRISMSEQTANQLATDRRGRLRSGRDNYGLELGCELSRCSLKEIQGRLDRDSRFVARGACFDRLSESFECPREKGVVVEWDDSTERGQDGLSNRRPRLEG